MTTPAPSCCWPSKACSCWTSPGRSTSSPKPTHRPAGRSTACRWWVCGAGRSGLVRRPAAARFAGRGRPARGAVGPSPYRTGGGCATCGRYPDRTAGTGLDSRRGAARAPLRLGVQRRLFAGRCRAAGGAARDDTHWAGADRLAARFPGVTVDADAIHVRDGKLRTAAGVTAGLDLALALVEEDLGREVAMRVASQLVMFFKRPGGQARSSAAARRRRWPTARPCRNSSAGWPPIRPIPTMCPALPRVSA